ncbi:MAG: hypothetical protein IOC58_04605 [Methylobacterium sp.]|nr:hypothetical protein [Methylobacterium sp.]
MSTRLENQADWKKRGPVSAAAEGRTGKDPQEGGAAMADALQRKTAPRFPERRLEKRFEGRLSGNREVIEPFYL